MTLTPAQIVRRRWEKKERALRCRGVVRTEGRTRGLGDRPLLVSLSVSYIPLKQHGLKAGLRT